MGAPTTDRGAIQQIIRALKAADIKLDHVFDQEENVPVTDEAEALDAIFAVDNAHLNVVLPDGKKGWVWFVLGNSPEEVAADYTLNLSDVLDPLTESWWD